MPSSRKLPPSAVPSSRFGRLARLGLAAGELVVGGAIEALRRLGSPDRTDTSALFTATSAARLAERLANLRGAAMKLGQLMSLQGEDVLPPQFAQALAILRAQAPPMPVEQLRRVLGRAYGRGWQARFQRFDVEPVAAASIGQVHRARTLDGRDLALKIQYPGVARSIASDVDNVSTLLRVARILPVAIDVGGVIAEAKRQLLQEADYVAEARFLERYAKLVHDEPGLEVPRVHWDYTTPRIMAMDFVDGVPLEALAAAHLPQRDRDRIGTLLERLLFRELFEFRTMQTDPNFANYLVRPGTGTLVLLDFGSTKVFSREFSSRYAAITRAIIRGDRAAIARVAQDIGYLSAGEPPARVQAVVDMILLVCEPLRRPGRYDFAASTLPSRVRDLGFDLAFRKGLLRAPPPETIFLHRKLLGSFLLLARLGARVDARRLVLSALAEG